MSFLGYIDLRIKHKHIHTLRFNLETHAVSRMYWWFLRKYETGKTNQVNIVVSDDWESEGLFGIEVEGFEEIHLSFNFSEYFERDKLSRKKKLLETIHTGMMLIAEKKGWEIEPLINAYEKCMEEELAYQFNVGKFKTSPNRKHKIGFWCNWDIDIFEVFWILTDRKEQEIKRQKFIECEPYKGGFIYFAKWKWLNNSNVLFEDTYKYSSRKKRKINLSKYL